MILSRSSINPPNANPALLRMVRIGQDRSKGVNVPLAYEQVVAVQVRSAGVSPRLKRREPINREGKHTDHMNFIAKHIQWLGLLLLGTFVAGATALYFDVPARLQEKFSAASDTQGSTCPMHAPQVIQESQAMPNHADCGMKADSDIQSGPGHAACQRTSSLRGTCCVEKETAIRLPPGHHPVMGMPTESALTHDNHHSDKNP